MIYCEVFTEILNLPWGTGESERVKVRLILQEAIYLRVN